MSEIRFETTKKVGIIGMIANLFLLCIKAIIGFITGSYAMIADAFNSATDIISSFMTYIGSKISHVPSDNDHNYGHGKAEYIFSLLIGVLMIVLCVNILYKSFMSIINKEIFVFSWWLVVVCIITIITKFVLYVYVHSKGKQIDSILVLANAQDHINDVFLTCGTLIGVLGALLNIYWLDGTVGCIIAIWIFYSGTRIALQSCEILMDKSIDENMKKAILDKIDKYPEIDKLDKISSKPIGNSYIVILEVSVNGDMTVNQSHDIITNLKYDILSINHIHDAIIHVNPLGCEKD